jgi:hypothetical protein
MFQRRVDRRFAGLEKTTARLPVVRARHRSPVAWSRASSAFGPASGATRRSSLLRPLPLVRAREASRRLQTASKPVSWATAIWPYLPRRDQRHEWTPRLPSARRRAAFFSEGQPEGYRSSRAGRAMRDGGRAAPNRSGQ